MKALRAFAMLIDGNVDALMFVGAVAVIVGLLL